MGSSQILSFITSPQGNVIYHILLAYFVASSLYYAFFLWRASDFPQARRTMIGLGILLGVNLLMFLVSGLGWQQIFNLNVWLPPLDRAFALIGLIWVIWLWAFPEPSAAADSVAALLSLLVASCIGFALADQGALNADSFNATVQDGLWQVTSVGFTLIGALVLLIRRPSAWGSGLVFMALAFLGHMLYLWSDRTAGDFPNAVRWAYLAAYPILLTLPQRFPAPTSQPMSVRQETSVPERRRYSTDPKTFHALLAVAAENNSTKMSQAITRAIAQTMLADLSFMIYLTDDNNQMVIAGGYDLIREDSLDGGSLSKNSIPMLANSIQRGRALRLPASSTSADIKGLGDILGLTNPGHLLYVPILTPEKETLGGILLLSPYSDRTWSAEDQAFLTNIAVSLVPIIQRNQRITKLEAQSELARAQVKDHETRIRELSSQLEAARAEADMNKSGDVASLRAAQDESQNIIEQLQRENAELRAGKNLPSVQAENELKTTLQEVTILQTQLAETRMKLLEAEKGQIATKNTEQAEVIASISQELRQPLSSIVGYTDLLLGESVGILGALQRKFVDRIKVSTERIRSLTDDMIQITTLATDLNELKPEIIDLNTIIDNAMSYTSSQIREKNISIHLEVPKSLSSIHADREALQQILIHLLQNAGAATPFEGTIRLKVQTRSENGMEYIMIQVTDKGGGISSEDMPRVFTRLYRADNVLIQGVGDTGVGLSIAKTLTEAQHGRIWVESEIGSGSTFSVLLPFAGEKPAEKQKRK